MVLAISVYIHLQTNKNRCVHRDYFLAAVNIASASTEYPAHAVLHSTGEQLRPYSANAHVPRSSGRPFRLCVSIGICETNCVCDVEDEREYGDGHEAFWGWFSIDLAKIGERLTIDSVL